MDKKKKQTKKATSYWLWRFQSRSHSPGRLHNRQTMQTGQNASRRHHPNNIQHKPLEGKTLTLLAKRSELSDSLKLSSSGEMFTNIKLDIKGNKTSQTSFTRP